MFNARQCRIIELLLDRSRKELYLNKICDIIRLLVVELVCLLQAVRLKWGITLSNTIRIFSLPGNICLDGLLVLYKSFYKKVFSKGTETVKWRQKPTFPLLVVAS